VAAKPVSDAELARRQALRGLERMLDRLALAENQARDLGLAGERLANEVAGIKSALAKMVEQAQTKRTDTEGQDGR
jgi:hypothetical protein